MLKILIIFKNLLVNNALDLFSPNPRILFDKKQNAFLLPISTSVQNSITENLHPLFCNEPVIKSKNCD